jgi:hypothetical protein
MRKKQFTIERNPKRVEMMKLMASDDMNVAYQAQTAMAKFMREFVQRLFDQKSTISGIFRKEYMAKGAPQTILVDPYEGYAEKDFHVWSITKPGGLTSQTVEGLSEYPFGYFNLDSALYFEKDYIEQARLDLLAKGINRVVQEFVAIEERLGWTMILTALAAGTNTNGQNHVINSNTAGVFQIDDFTRLKTLITRLYQSFASGSIAGDYGLTDLYMSPERMADLTRMSYNPMNTYGIPNSDESTSLGLPDKIREEIFRASGTKEMWGVEFHELRELGLGRKLNVIFDGVSTNTPTYNNATQDLMIGMDLSQDVAISPVESGDSGETVKVAVDNQYFYNRQNKAGWFFTRRNGYAVIDNRWLCGLIV